MSKIVGVDVGGTFTDLIVLDEATGAVNIAKVPSTPDNQAFGVLSAIEQGGAALDEIETIVHGTTVTTNALLERKIATCGLITTKGFRDSLELGRRTRPNPYGLIGSFECLIPRNLRLEAIERMYSDGEVVMPLDEQSVRDAVQQLIEDGVETLYSCKTGVCKTCAVKVLDGEPIHRDTVLTENEKGNEQLMCLCVSRASTKELTLDI